jgi:hypothetical protein
VKRKKCRLRLPAEYLHERIINQNENRKDGVKLGGVSLRRKNYAHAKPVPPRSEHNLSALWKSLIGCGGVHV